MPRTRSPPDPPTLILVTSAPRRTSSVRWLTLSALLQAVERGVEASARLDAHSPRDHRLTTDPAAVDFEARLRTLERRIDRELDRLTVDRLRVDLAAKQASRARV